MTVVSRFVLFISRSDVGLLTHWPQRARRQRRLNQDEASFAPPAQRKAPVTADDKISPTLLMEMATARLPLPPL
jgi:hypothetical protein